MGNKILILLLILGSCNRHPEKRNIDKNEYYAGQILLFGFEKYKIYKISFADVSNKQLKIDYKLPKFDSIHNYETVDLYFQLDTISTKFINKGCYIIINDKLKYKITNVKSGEIERYGNFGSVGYDIYLKEYKLNDSLIKGQGHITIYKEQ
jgi:hypothetical protein